MCEILDLLGVFMAESYTVDEGLGTLDAAASAGLIVYSGLCAGGCTLEVFILYLIFPVMAER